MTTSSRSTHQGLMQAAVDEAARGMADGRGGPFGAVVARNGQVLAVASNRVVRDRDPTAHAEVCAIRGACEKLETHLLDGCEIYATCEPCPMCLSAIFWARIDRIYCGTTREDAARAGFDDAAVYREVASPYEQRKIPIIRLSGESSESLFETWAAMSNKIPY